MPCAEAAGLPFPRDTWEDPYLVLTLYRSAAAAVHALSPELLDRLNADEKVAWESIVGREVVASSEVMKQMGFDERKAQRVLKKLQDVGLLRRVGGGRATRFKVVRT
jgi:ATP-dependent DNA helicase RecG